MIYLFLATLCFSFSFGLIKSQIAPLPPDVVVFLRLFIAGIIFLPFFINNAKNLPKNQIKNAALIGILQYGIMYICFLRAFKYLQGNEIVLLTASTPMFVIIFSSIFTKKIDWRYFACVIIAITGALIVALGTTPPKFLIKGVLFMETSNLTFALGQLLWKKYVSAKSVQLIGLSYFAACAFVLPFVIFKGFSNFHPTTLQWLSILYLGFIPTGLGFWLWNRGAKCVNDAALAVMNNLKIPFGVFFALLIFHEKTDIVHFSTGATLILIAIIWSICIKN